MITGFAESVDESAFVVAVYPVPESHDGGIRFISLVEQPQFVIQETRVMGKHHPSNQRQALEAAYYGGYFDWPRESTTEEIAESMEISSPTLHRHLRQAEK